MIISTAEEMNPLRRSNMEDVHVVTELTVGRGGSSTSSSTNSSSTTKQQEQHHHDDSYQYLAVYDGHGGRDTVDFLQQALHVNVQEELREASSMASSSNSSSSKENKQDPNQHAVTTDNNNNNSSIINIPACLERALLITDIQARQFGITSSGATVAICLIHTSNSTNSTNSRRRTLYTANCGDARIVHGCRTTTTTNNSNNNSDDTSTTTKTIARRLSHDHSAHDPVEVNRITHDKGGFCFKGRVAGVLAVARSLGDFGLKEFVTAEPYTDVYECCHQQHNSDNGVEQSSEFVILACDGVWDVMTDQQAVDLVSHYKGTNETVASELTKHAIQRGTADNITVLVCWL